MDASVLIKILDDIDNKLWNQTYKEKQQVMGTLSGQIIDLPDKTIYRYSGTELVAMYERKSNIIINLYKQGIVDDEGYKEYMLSEDAKFTPRLNLNYFNNPNGL